MVKTYTTDFVNVFVHPQAVVERDIKQIEMISKWNNRASDINRSDIREIVRMLQSAEENSIGFLRVEG